MSRFSLSSDMSFNYDKIIDIYKKRYVDTSKNIYKSMVFNSDIDELLFLYTYISDCINKYQALVESFDFLDDKDSVRDYMNEVWKLTEDTVNFYYDDGKMENALRYFVNRLLKLIYQDSEFVIINIGLTTTVLNNVYKIVIEPIVLEDKGNLLNREQADNVIELLMNIFSLDDSFSKRVSITVIESDLWCSNCEVPKIINDNMFTHLFENQPIMLKMLFKARHILHESYGLNTSDISIHINLNEEQNRQFLEKFKTMSDYNGYVVDNSSVESEIELENDKEYYESVNFKIEEDSFNYAVEKLYNDINKENKFTNQKESIGEKEQNDSFINISDKVLKILRDVEKHTNDKSTEFTSIGVKKESPKNEEVVDIDINNVLDISSIESDTDGYIPFRPDYYSSKEIESIFKFKDYFNNIFNICKHNNNVNSDLIKNVTEGYNKDLIKVLTVDKIINGYSVEMGTSFDESHNYRFTILEESGIIDNIYVMK